MHVSTLLAPFAAFASLGRVRPAAALAGSPFVACFAVLPVRRDCFTTDLLVEEAAAAAGGGGKSCFGAGGF